MEITDFSFIQTQLDVIERNLNDLEGVTVDTTVATEVIDNVLQSFDALNESNLDKMDPDKLEIVTNRVSNIHERIEGLFDKHVMTGDVEDRIRSQMDQLTSHLPQKEVWTELISDSRFSKVFKKAAQNELGEGVDENMISKLPFEVLMLIFRHLPDDRKALGLTSKAVNYVIRRGDMTDVHLAYRLDDLENAMNKVDGFSERWEAHMNVVTSRLEESGKEPTARNVYEEFIKFQAERFPPAPFKDENDPFSVEGYLERESIIKNWNAVLYLQKARGEKFSPITDREKLLESLDKVNWEHIYLEESDKNIGDPLSEIPTELNESDDITASEFNIHYIPKDCFSQEGPIFRVFLNNNKIVTIEKDTFSNLIAGRIFLNDNKIKKINEEAFSHPELAHDLKDLNLRNNNIKTLDAKTFDTLNLTKLDLRGNPLDKSTKEMLTKLREKVDTVLFDE
ncbi:MAG: hypothetical protein K940chlam3_01581 [Chlamydiae bacterium]|nr:hypothetical protein [Chlamydiota bacterium]